MTKLLFIGKNKGMKNRLIIVENHMLIADELQILLTQSENFTCDIASDFEQMVELMAKETYDALIIDDLLLTNVDFSQYRKLSFPPAIVLADGDTEINPIIQSYYLLEKPFRLNDLLDALDRMVTNVHWQFGPWYFHTNKNYLTINDCKTNLTEKESDILNYLCRAGGKTVKREKLLQDVWGYKSGIDTHTLETHIYRLRQKIESGSQKPEFLLSDKHGYRLLHLKKSYSPAKTTTIEAT